MRRANGTEQRSSHLIDSACFLRGRLMDKAPFLSRDVTASPFPPTDALPMMLNVLVCRLQRAEVRQRIAKDWEMFALGTCSVKRSRGSRT